MTPVPQATSARLLSALALLGITAASPIFANPTDSVLCDQAAHRAARTVGVPLDILLAITRAETGRSDGGAVLPWPWAINRAGDGAWYDDKSAALSAAEEALANGEGNFDVGCFQLNYRWHGAAFASLEAMFDPEANALYAAQFLAQLHESSGDWSQAISDYHSRTDDLAEIYLARVEALLGGTLTESGTEIALQDDLPDAVRVNLFPLLQGGEAGSAGSLVPRTESRGGLFADRS